MRKNLGCLFLCFVGVQSCATRDFGEGGGAETQSGTGAFRVAVTVRGFQSFDLALKAAQLFKSA